MPTSITSFMFENYSIFIGEYLKINWNVCDFLVEETFLRDDLKRDSNMAIQVVSKYESVLDLTTYVCLPSVIKFFKHLLLISQNQVIISTVIHFKFVKAFEMNFLLKGRGLF